MPVNVLPSLSIVRLLFIFLALNIYLALIVM